MADARKAVRPRPSRGADSDATPVAARLTWVVAAAIIAYGLIRVIQSAWVCDDAFISFRYARNLIQGHGLVYNVGEVVEGYSNFLWTMIVALGMRLGAEPVRLTETLGVVCYAATIFLLVRTSLRATPRGRGRRLALPLAALALSLHAHARLFATGGLETSLFTLELTALAVLTVQSRSARDYLLVGLVGVAIALTRPDGPLFYAAAGGVALVDSVRRRDARLVLLLALPGVALYLPYFLWRFHYYGYLFPNTFYAKTAGGPSFGRGLFYLWLYFRCYYVLAVGVVALPFLAARRRGLPARTDDPAAPWTGLRGPAVLLAFVLADLLLVLWTGGDFMFARFLVPVTPLVYLGIEFLVRGVRDVRWRYTLAAAVLLATVVTWYPRVIVELLNKTGVVDEPLIYPRERIAEAKRTAAHLNRLLVGTEPRIVIFGRQAMLAYYGEFPLVIEGETGLTDEHVAHLPIVERSRVGHEKRAPVEYLRQRGVDFVFVWPGAIPSVGFSDINFDGVSGQLVTYRKEVMDRLKGRPDVQFWDFEAYLHGLVPTLGTLPREELEKQYALWKSVYFDHNDDPELEAAFETAIARAATRIPSLP